jgi:hypothetical protein
MTMTIDHPLYPEFLVRLAGPEGINLRGDGTSDGIGSTDTSKTAAILRDLGFGEPGLMSSLAYFAARGGVNDREILLHVDMSADDEQTAREGEGTVHDETFDTLSRHGHDDHEEAMRHLDEN